MKTTTIKTTTKAKSKTSPRKTVAGRLATVEAVAVFRAERAVVRVELGADGSAVAGVEAAIQAVNAAIEMLGVGVKVLAVNVAKDVSRAYAPGPSKPTFSKKAITK